MDIMYKVRHIILKWSKTIMNQGLIKDIKWFMLVYKFPYSYL